MERGGFIISLFIAGKTEAQLNLQTCSVLAANQWQHHITTVLSLHPMVPRLERCPSNSNNTETSQVGWGHHKQASPVGQVGWGGYCWAPGQRKLGNQELNGVVSIPDPEVGPPCPVL